MSNRLGTLFALSALASFGLLAPGHAIAGPAPAGSVFFTIDDAGLTSGNPNNIFASLAAGAYITPTSSGITSGNFAGGPIVIVNESLSTLGSVDDTFNYADPTPLSLGASVTVNFNIFETNSGPLSDTLSITLTGISSFGQNTQVSLHFLSDNDLLPLSPLANAISITETGAYQELSVASTGLTAFHLRFASDVEPVPLPSAVWSGLALLAGLGAMHFVRRRPKSSISQS